MAAAPHGTRRAATTMAAFAALAAFTLANESPWFMGAALALAALSFVGARWTARLLLTPRLGGVLAAIAAVGSMVFLAPPVHMDSMVPSAGIAMATALLVRLWTMRPEGDDLATIHMAAVLLVLAAFTSHGAMPTLVAAAAIPVVIHATMAERLAHSGRLASGARMAVLNGSGAMARPFMDSAARRSALASITALLVVMSVFLAVVLFVAFPRQANRASWWRGGFRSGLVSQVDLSVAGPISSSRREVLRVAIIDPSDERSGELGAIYLRAGTADHYDRQLSRWSTQRESPSFLQPGAGEWTLLGSGRPAETGGIWRADLATRGTPLTPLPLPQPAFAIQLPGVPVLPFHARSGEAMVAEVPSWSVLFKPHPTQADLSLLNPFPGAADRGPRPFISDAFPAAVGAVAMEIDASIDPAITGWERSAAYADAVRQYLSRSPFRYTLEMPTPAPGVDPIESFLARNQRGHCELFASAAVALCQAAGHEARLANGFLATEFNGVTATYTVRESDAHAWPEVRVGPWEWRNIDPSPLEYIAVQRSTQRSWSDAVLAAIAPVEEAFSRLVVGFDKQAQAQLWRDVREWPGRAWEASGGPALEWVRGTARTLFPDPDDAWPARTWLVSIGATICAGAMALFARRYRRDRLRRIWSPTKPYRSPHDAVLNRCARFAPVLAALRASCGPRPAGATLRQWLEGAPGLPPERRTELQAGVAGLYAARFGPP